MVDEVEFDIMDEDDESRLNDNSEHECFVCLSAPCSCGEVEC